MPLWTNADSINGRPKYANSDNSQLYGNTYAMSPSEMMDANNVVRHPPHAGWIAVKAYQDVHGNARYKFETLVCLSNVTSDQANDNVFFGNT